MLLFNKKIISFCLLKKNNGRNNRGVITVRGRSGINKKPYYFLTGYRQNKQTLVFVLRFVQGRQYQVIQVFKNSQRSSYLNLIKNYITFEFFVVLSSAFQDCKKKVYLASSNVFCLCRNSILYNVGDRVPLHYLNTGIKVHAVTRATNHVCYGLSAGSFLQIIFKQKIFCILRLPSGHVIKLDSNNIASVGIVSNVFHYLKTFSKAGEKHNIGYRPKVRGVAINPVDHPHGGGENKSKIGKHPVNPWGLKTKGYKTKF